MKKIQNFIIILFFAVVTSGCSSDFVEIYNKTSISPDVFPSTMAQMDLLTNSMYGAIHTYHLYGFVWLPLSIYLYDHTSDLSWTADMARNVMALNKTIPSAEYNTSVFTGIFKMIEACNSVLEAADRYAEKSAQASELPALNYIKGQALYLRAFAYWHAQIYCQVEPTGMGVPLKDKVPKTIDEMLKERSTTAEYWDFVIKDLTEASALLAGKTDTRRATEWAAKALLAKAYAFSGDWANAKPALKDVIDNSGKELVPFETYRQMFNGDSNYEFNKESLYEVDLSVDMSQWGAWDPSGGSSMPMIFAATYVNGSGGTQAAGWGNNFIHDKNLSRFGFTLPVPVLTPNPAYDASREITAQNMKEVCSPEYIQASLAVRREKTVDPRLFISCAQPYIDTLHTIDNGILTKRLVGHFIDVESSYQAWSHKKFINLLGQESDLSMNSGANIPFIRLADIYLLYAESCKDTEPATALE
jgi:hypothetical protein